MATDEELAARLASGDEAALRELLGRYEGPLASFIHRNTAGRDVEDLYQETWLRVVRNASRFDPRRRFSTWLFQIAVNLCRDWHRRSPPEPVALDSSAEVAAPAESIDARIEAQRLLGSLPDAQREVVLLRYFHDLTEAQVAEIVGCPRGTVKSRMHAALKHLGEIARTELMEPTEPTEKDR